MEENYKERDGGEYQRKRWRRIEEKEMEENRRERDGGEKTRKDGGEQKKNNRESYGGENKSNDLQ